MRTYKSKGQREPYAVMLDIVSEGMTIASKDNPLCFEDGTTAYFADRRWHVKQGEDWTTAETAQHNNLEYQLSKGLFK